MFNIVLKKLSKVLKTFESSTFGFLATFGSFIEMRVAYELNVIFVNNFLNFGTCEDFGDSIPMGCNILIAPMT